MRADCPTGMKSSHTLSRQAPRATAQHALPAPGERRRLRELWDLTPQQVAVAFGVRAATVRSWESGRSQPRGERREAYRRFLQGLAQRADPQPRTAVLPASRRPEPSRALAASAAGEPANASVPEARLAPSVAASPAPGSAAAGWAREADTTSQPAWMRRVGAVAVVFGGWALVLVLLDTWLPGWTG